MRRGEGQRAAKGIQHGLQFRPGVAAQAGIGLLVDAGEAPFLRQARGQRHAVIGCARVQVAGAGVDDQLPRIAEVEQGPGDGPN